VTNATRLKSDSFPTRGTATQRATFSVHCFAEADTAEARWLERVETRVPKAYPGFLYGRAWREFDREAGMKHET
jgi:hypothetical protein